MFDVKDGIKINKTTIIDSSLNLTNTGNISMSSSCSKNIYKARGMYLGWASGYGTQFNHSITSSDGGTYGDHITINSYGNIRMNFDSNSNGTNTFKIGHATTGTGNTIFELQENGHLRIGADGYPDASVMVFMDDKNTGGVWDTYCFMGRTNILENETTSPVFEGSGNIGFKAQANSDGMFIGLEEYSTGNYRPVFDWGDDAGEDFHIRHNGSYRGFITTTGNLTMSGNITAYSDINLKDNINNIDNALEKVNSIRGVTYDRIDQDLERQTGVIAQEVEKVLPEVVHTNDDGIKSVAYGNMVGLLIEAIKELKAEIEELKK